jgi:hypothetical protein
VPGTYRCCNPPCVSCAKHHLLQTFNGVDLKHQFRARAPGPPRVTAPVTTTVLPRLLLQHQVGSDERSSKCTPFCSFRLCTRFSS